MFLYFRRDVRTHFKRRFNARVLWKNQFSKITCPHRYKYDVHVIRVIWFFRLTASVSKTRDELEPGRNSTYRKIDYRTRPGVQTDRLFYTSYDRVRAPFSANPAYAFVGRRRRNFFFSITRAARGGVQVVTDAPFGRGTDVTRQRSDAT